MSRCGFTVPSDSKPPLPRLPGPVEMRDYLAAWLGVLLKESYIVKVEEMKGVEIVHSKH